MSSNGCSLTVYWITKLKTKEVTQLLNDRMETKTLWLVSSAQFPFNHPCHYYWCSRRQENKVGNQTTMAGKEFICKKLRQFQIHCYVLKTQKPERRNSSLELLASGCCLWRSNICDGDRGGSYWQRLQNPVDNHWWWRAIGWYMSMDMIFKPLGSCSAYF